MIRAPETSGKLKLIDFLKKTHKNTPYIPNAAGL